jgi:hypothetical protein
MGAGERATPIGWAANYLRKLLSTVAIVFAKQAARLSGAWSKAIWNQNSQLQSLPGDL